MIIMGLCLAPVCVGLVQRLRDPQPARLQEHLHRAHEIPLWYPPVALVTGDGVARGDDLSNTALRRAFRTSGSRLYSSGVGALRYPSVTDVR